ncbi:MAG TPA: disulfide oxidoreductase [Virgibacillus sp.]|nr:disulfide oxidoreductase [Virgibacillus sp.]
MINSERNETILLLIWGQALVALLGSLFYSEILGYTPCDLCWMQRIFMYPLVVIYGVAAIKKDLSIALPGLILSGIGALVSIYHYLIQKLAAFQSIGDVCGEVPCNLQYVNYFGFITIPFLAATAFILIFILHIVLLVQNRRK